MGEAYDLRGAPGDPALLLEELVELLAEHGQGLLLGLLERLAAEELVEARPRHTPLGKLLVAELEPGKPGCPPLLEKTARQLGAAKPEAVVAVNNRVLLESVAEAAGYEALKALIEKGCLVPEEGGIYAAVEKTRC